MDTSESENSDGGERTTDDEWVASRKRLGGKRSSNNGGRSSVASDQSDPIDSESSKSGRSGEGITPETANTTPSGGCCSCSKYSSCKTTKCPCRAAGGSCGISCGCVPKKCANRGSVLNKDSGETAELEIVEGNGSGSGSDETEKSRILASQGAMLLQSALIEKPAETNDDNGSKRKPLSDIGNTLVCLSRSHPVFWNLFVLTSINLCFAQYMKLLHLLKFVNYRPRQMHQSQIGERNGENLPFCLFPILHHPPSLKALIPHRS